MTEIRQDALAPAAEPERTWCGDYDPDYKLHGCELEAHAADEPHRDLLGNEWLESLQLPCPSVSGEGVTCGLHFGHFPARHRPAGSPVWESEWTDEVYDRSGRRKPRAAGLARSQALSLADRLSAASAAVADPDTAGTLLDLVADLVNHASGHPVPWLATP